MVKELIVSLGLDLELTAEEIADIFWLTRIRQQSQAIDDNRTQNESENKINETHAKNTRKSQCNNVPIIWLLLRGINCMAGILFLRKYPTSKQSFQSNFQPQATPQNNNNQQNLSSSTSESPKELGLFTQTSPINFERGFPIRVPNASLDEPLRFMRSLRPLIQPIAVQESFNLDEAATVKKIVEERIFLPVLKPILEPWLDLVLVIDESPSMKIWQQTINEITQLLGRYGIFGDVRTFGIVQDGEKVYLRTGVGREIDKQTIINPSSLIEPGGRRLILILTDCVATLWYSKSILPILKIWAEKCPMALVQVLPEWLWERTALGDKTLVQLFGLAPGIPNQKLSIVPDPFRDIGKTKFDDYEDIIAYKTIKDGDKEPKKNKKLQKLELKVPILSLEPKFASVWSCMISGQGGVKTPGFIFEYDLEIDSPENPTEAVNLNKYELTPEERVDRFWNASSNLAWRLAGLLAASPEINLPVTRLIQQNFLPSSKQSHVAEVFLGGLLEPKNPILLSSHPDSISYQFVHEQVRNLLLDNAPATDTVSVLSSYIARRWGKTLDEFTAQLKLLLENSDNVSQQKALPFAIVSTEVLRRRGGKYKEIVSNLDRLIGRQSDDADKPKYDFSGFPELQDLLYEPATIVLLKGIELQTQQFEVAEVATEKEWQTFEFVTAKLELIQKPAGLLQRLNPFRRDREREIKEWVINQQRRQGQQLIEQLSNEVELEMVLIPPGEFMMGAAPKEQGSSSNERPQHRVKIDYSFLMGKYPITQAQWRTVAALPQVNRELTTNPARFKGDKRPVERVNWYEAKEFCARLSQYTEREYRLPSEAEWEYACRSVISNQLSVTSRPLTVDEWNQKYNQPFHFGATITTDLANYNGRYIYGEGKRGEYRQETTPVDKFGFVNDFGLCDMHGNVWEWCEDHWHDNYQNAPTDGSAWLSDNKSSFYVIRGGSWYSIPNDCRSAARLDINPEGADDNIGFRVVCRVPRTL